MIRKLYTWFHKLTSRPGEAGEYSAGYLQDKVRQEALALCRHRQGNILEVGCGEGLFLAQLAGQNRDITIWGVDNNRERLTRAGEKIKGVNLSLQDALSLSFADEFFDTVICLNTIFNMESIGAVRQALKEMKRTCKAGGSIIFDFRNSGNPLLSVKYALAGYYDDTVRTLPLKTYNMDEIKGILKDLGLAITNRRFIGPRSRILAAAIVMEAKKPC
jgi:ubiquinone/menaquinone biosynthesis C-methylase UbiE